MNTFWIQVIFCVHFLLLSFVTSNYFFVDGPPKTRDEGEFCCNKYGMTLPSINGESENTFLHNSLTPFGFSKVWIGVLRAEDDWTNLTWADGTDSNYTNWENNSITNMDSFLNESRADDSLCVYADITKNFKWFVVLCNETAKYGCEIGDINPPPKNTNLTNVDCPELLKYTSRTLSREPNTGIRYGLFEKEPLFTSIGTQLGMVTSFSGVEECTLFCLANSQCNDVIILNNQICLLYKVTN